MSKLWRAVKSGWYLWLFPIAAIAITAWLVMDYQAQVGPTIKILFDDASGIKAGKTDIRYRGVSIGSVTDVSISPDRKDVVAKVVLRKDAASFAVDGSRFSLVLPKVSFQGISGLETLFEGTYIAVSPGPINGSRKTVFRAQSAEQTTDPIDDTSPYLVSSSNVESINIGDSVTYRGLKVGSVTKLTLAKESQSVLVQISVENKYARLIRTNTVFWRKLAVHAKFGLFGSEIKVNSMDSIMNSGFELATPNEPGEVAKAYHRFTLSDGAPKDVGDWNPVLTFSKPGKKIAGGKL